MSSLPEPSSIVASDQTCLAAAGDESDWFKQEVQPHEPALRSYLRHRFPSVDVDDVVQESYLKLLKVRAKGTVASAKTYVFAIARNSALAVFRRRKIFSDIPVSELPEWRALDERTNGVGVGKRLLHR